MYVPTVHGKSSHYAYGQTVANFLRSVPTVEKHAVVQQSAILEPYWKNLPCSTELARLSTTRGSGAGRLLGSSRKRYGVGFK